MDLKVTRTRPQRSMSLNPGMEPPLESVTAELVRSESTKIGQAGIRRFSTPSVPKPQQTFGSTLKPISNGNSEDYLLSSIAYQERVEKATEKCAKRVNQHIGQFFKLQVVFDQETFDITIQKTQTIEQLAHQIEAEYTFKRFVDSGGPKKDGPELQPLQISQVFNSGQLALNFSDIIEDVLQFDDTIFVINAYQVSEPPSSPIKRSSTGTVTTIDTFRDQNNVDNRTLDDRLQLLLHNKIGLALFHEFCIKEYQIENLLFWLDVETLQSLEPTSRDVFAKNIYLVYIAHNSPLKINVTPEVRAEITNMFTKAAQIDVSVFDEAQQNVYTVIKSHSFVRFEKNGLLDLVKDAKKRDKERYNNAKISPGTFGFHFPVDDEGLDSLNHILENPSSPESAAKLNSLGDGKPLAVDSNQFKELFLVFAVRQYFPESTHDLVSYFDDASRQRWSEKQRKMQKEKKITKFFGERPSNEQMKRQVAKVLYSVEDQNTEGTNMEPRNSIQEVDEEGDGVVSSTRRKKMEKLETFFGNRIPTQQKVEQHLVSGQDNCLVVNEDTDSSESEDGEVIDVDVDTKNDLDPEQRRVLNKRNKKLQNMLGETLDKNIITNFTEAAIKEKTDEPQISPLSIMNNNSPTSDIVGDDEEIAKQQKKTRLDKLSSVLGTRIKVDQISESQGTVSTTPQATDFGRQLPAPRVLTSGERKTVQKRANKIERLLGALPPTEAIISTGQEKELKPKYSFEGPSLTAHNQIASLSLVIENATDFVDVFLAIANIGKEQPDGSNSAVNANANADADEMDGPDMREIAKENRKRKLQKLRKMLGNDIDAGKIIEQQLFTELENSIHEQDIAEADRQALQQEIDQLRDLVKRRSMTLERELQDKPRGSEVKSPAAKGQFLSPNDVAPGPLQRSQSQRDPLRQL